MVKDEALPGSLHSRAATQLEALEQAEMGRGNSLAEDFAQETLHRWVSVIG